ncbi:dsDNA nuclease domain-containing protein [Mesorhizobium sp. M4B.F.Ca.ET.089.01.1.1]|uniref:dsDNA nuclease domain-containing protein n=1 Tax=Mesorhizobium sp. M4B.F.Ca.ET.089.01.1.1 TaxID=2496662 RepID=UPI0016741EEB|nr:dsDNA nuclease domain-containing protein [Mesorhizobium sp. M4B.F.Ca.ET.089.01.1.1]
MSNDAGLSEVGGGHNQKGIEFQRNWALIRMFELEEAGELDFLLLFEVIQDVAVLDSSTAPTAISIYQVKKKDRKEWAWGALTSLHTPELPGKKKVKAKPLTDFLNSPVGKLYATVRAFSVLNSHGRFISNAGCDLPLVDGTNAATSMPTALSELSPHLRDLLSEGMKILHGSDTSTPDLSKIYVERVRLPVDDPSTFTVGIAHKFLLSRSPRHAGQARSLVDALLAKVGPLGAKTDTCKSFAEVRQLHGYSRDEFAAALGNLEELRDLLHHLETWLTQITQEGMGFMDVTAIRAAASAIYRRQVMGSHSARDNEIAAACDAWLAGKADPVKLLPFFTDALAHLSIAFPAAKKAELQAHLALRAIMQCVDPT